MSPTKRLGIVVLMSAVGACTSMGEHPMDENGTGEDGASGSPLVEAYIEYPGPQERWAGPSSFLVHVVARDAEEAKVTVTPPHLFGGTEVSTRKPASHDAIALSSDRARQELASLGIAMHNSEPGFRGCMSPVRARLIRANGSVVEKVGCRSQSGWPMAASRAVSFFLSETVGR